MKKNISKYLVPVITAGFIFASCNVPEYPFTNVTPGNNSAVEFTDYSSYKISAANVSKEFMRGIDMSEVKALEECGQKFYDENNVEKDVFQILRDKGVNYVRLRIWNDYTQALNDSWGPTGYNNLYRTIDMAKRASRCGMSILLDFHYSDNWADPNKQYIPEMWKSFVEDESGNAIPSADIDIEGLAAAVASYTKEVLDAMENAGCAPAMVQLGNESQGGIFKLTRTGASEVVGYGTDSNNKSYSSTGDGNATNLTDAQRVTILTAAAKAVRKTIPQCKIMLHMSNGANISYRTKMVSLANSIGNDDQGNKLVTVIGVSYYPFYTSHGTDAALKSNLQAIVDAGYKPVIAESSFAYDNKAYTDTANNEFYFDDEPLCAQTLLSYNKGTGITESTGLDVKAVSAGTKIISASIENQAGVIAYVMELCSSVDSTGGYFYWGGAYLGIDNVMESSWENQALFDVTGKALPALNVFNVQ